MLRVKLTVIHNLSLVLDGSAESTPSSWMLVLLIFELPCDIRKRQCQKSYSSCAPSQSRYSMAPKSKKCSMCGTNSTTRWIILSRKTVCASCYDLQCNPPLEPKQEVADEPVAGPSGLGRKNETILATGPVQSNPADDAIFRKPTFIPPKPSKVARRSSTASATATATATATTSATTSTLTSNAQQAGSRVKTPSRNKARKSFPSKPMLTDETKRPKSVEKAFHDGFWYEVGDIVSLVDAKDNTYYAQIRGLVVDVFNEKSAILTWLVPTVDSPPPNEGFDPATYHIGPDEDEMRDLRQVRFVMHAPSGYYFNRNHPFPRKTVTGPVKKDGRSTEEPEFDWANIFQLHLGKRSAGT